MSLTWNASGRPLFAPPCSASGHATDHHHVVPSTSHRGHRLPWRRRHVRRPHIVDHLSTNTAFESIGSASPTMRSPHGPTALLPRRDHSQKVLLSCICMLAVTPASWAWSTSTWLLWFAQTARHSLYYILALPSLRILFAKKTLSPSRPGLSQPAQPATPWPTVHQRLAKPSPTSSPLSHLRTAFN